MCGRYALNQNARELADHFHLLEPPPLAPRYNIAPSTPTLIVWQSPKGRVAEPVIWGLEPAWTRKANNDKSYPKPINARAETILERPMFRNAFRHRRCIIPASGFYEWKGAAAPKQPYYIYPTNDPVFAFAGIFEMGEPDGVPTCCIITTHANALMATIHDRMPVILSPENVDVWLDGSLRDAEITPLLRPFPAERMQSHAVSTRVNSAKNEDAGLIAPLPETE